MSKEPKTSPRKVRSTARSRAALDLRAQGLSYRDIADRLGIGRTTAHRYVTRELAYLAQECREDAEQIRTLELQRLDALYVIAARVASDGDLAGIDRCVKIAERRAKLLGLDQAQKVEHSGQVTWVDLVRVATDDSDDQTPSA